MFGYLLITCVHGICLLCEMIINYWPYNKMIISNYILFVNYEKIHYHIWFFQKKTSNDLEANNSGATLPTTNIEENLMSYFPK